MKNLWNRLAPFASDTTGACTVFKRQNALVIAQDSNGSVSVLRRVIDLGHAEASYETVDLPEISYTLGRERDFQDRMVELVEETVDERRRRREAPLDFVVLVNGPVANLLGVDLQGRALTLSERVGLPVLAVETTGNRYYDRGVEAAYEVIYERFVRTDADDVQKGSVQPGGVNFLGLTELDWPGRAYVKQVAKWLNAGGRRVIADFGFGDSPKAWRAAPQAEENIVFSVAGLALARRMKRDFGIPYTVLCETDWFDELTDGLRLQESPRVLVVGEQVSSNLVRRLLERMGAARVEVGTFYQLDKQLKHEGDRRFKDEGELVRTLRVDGGYDFVVCDAALAACSETPVFPLMHPPTGFGARDNTELSREWLEQMAGEVR